MGEDLETAVEQLRSAIEGMSNLPADDRIDYNLLAAGLIVVESALAPITVGTIEEKATSPITPIDLPIYNPFPIIPASHNLPILTPRTPETVDTGPEPSPEPDDPNAPITDPSKPDEPMVITEIRLSNLYDEVIAAYQDHSPKPLTRNSLSAQYTPIRFTIKFIGSLLDCYRYTRIN